MNINGFIFLTSISHHLYFRTAQYIDKKAKQKYKNCIEQIIQLYQKGNFEITNIHCDSKYKYILQDITMKYNINLHCAPAQSYDPDAERNIRTIKERVRSLYMFSHTNKYRKLSCNTLSWKPQINLITSHQDIESFQILQSFHDTTKKEIGFLKQIINISLENT